MAANSDPTNNAVSQNREIGELPKEVNPKIGYNSGKHWSDDEINVLKSFIDSKSWEDINWKDIRDEEKLFGRDLKAIRDKARKLFKKEIQDPEIRYNTGKPWSHDENNALKSLLDAKSWKDINWEEIRDEEKLFGRDLNAIQDKARKFFKSKGKKAMKVAENCELPWNVLDIISKALDFDDLFRFSGVCKNWRAFYWRNLLASEEPFFKFHIIIRSQIPLLASPTKRFIA